MSSAPTPPLPPATRSVVPTPPLTLTRTGTRTFTAGNGRGGEILVGPEDVEGAFTPGELLKIAVAGCAGMSADHRLAHLLGEDFAGVVTVVGHKDEANERYSHYELTIAAPESGVDADDVELTTERARHLIEKNCTVGRTLAQPTPYHVSFDVG